MKLFGGVRKYIRHEILINDDGVMPGTFIGNYANAVADAVGLGVARPSASMILTT